MNQLHLRRRLGAVSPQAFQRIQNERLIEALGPLSVSFNFRTQLVSDAATRIASTSLRSTTNLATDQEELIAHKAGTNVLVIDRNEGRFLISGGADSTIRLWDLESRLTGAIQHTLRPAASLTRSTPASHTHALTSISIYPFDPTPSTLLTTAYDKTLKLTSITPSELVPVHSFALDYAPFTHALSPIPTSSPLIAVGTALPAIKLVDLRSGLASHALPGHNGAVYSVAWSPRQENVLASGATDGRVLFFDIRRSQSAFASLDLDDAIGVLSPDHTPGYSGRPAMDWNIRAHGGPVTGLCWTSSGDKLVTVGHDQRIRVWDAATGRNDLVHFGPRIRNERNSEFAPLMSPAGFGAPGKEVLFWANDDGKGEIFVFNMREGNMMGTLRTPGTARGPAQARVGGIAKFNSVGRINAMAWRINAASGGGVEMYSAHANGAIHCWVGMPPDEEEIEDRIDMDVVELDRKRKRKRDLIGDIVEGFTKKPIAFT
jgi:DNA excision repair protein ERCC-8